MSAGAPSPPIRPVPAASEPAGAGVTFIGFQGFDDGTSRIFVHITAEPALRVESTERRIVFTLAESHILIRNNKNPLDLRHFPTPVERAQLKQRGDDVDVVIDLKQAVSASHRFSDNSNGSVSLQVDFPAPKSP